MIKVIPFNEQERIAARAAEQSKPKVSVIMTEEQRKLMLQAISFAAYGLAKSGDHVNANEFLDLNKVLNSGSPLVLSD